MSILVTGGAGYIGSHFIHTAIDTGREQLVVVDNLSTGTRNAVPDHIPFYHTNVADRDGISRIIQRHQVKTIVHFAGSIIVPESVTNPLKYYSNNTSASKNLIETAITQSVENFVFSSTAAVYGHASSEPIDETHPIDPISPYGASKYMTERMLTDVGKAHQLNYAILRYFNVAGADPFGRTGQRSPDATHLIKRALLAATGQTDAISVFGTDYDTPDGTAVRDFIHVSDLARAHMATIGYLENGGESQVFNCGYGKGNSVLDVVECVKRVSGQEFDVKLEPRRAGDASEIVADPKRLREKLDWFPERNNLDDIVADALAWEKTRLLDDRLGEEPQNQSSAA
ncbi:MAG: UDP-glucose 4-epimerase GalE [Pseudomonadota bacterium]